jgi:hypothetical protein
MTHIYRSKIGWEVIGLVLIVFGIILYTSLDQLWKHQAYAPLVILSVVFLFILWVQYSITYVVRDNVLVVKAMMVETEIPVKKIHRIRKTLNPVSSPAAALFGRIEIFYDNGKSIIVSPSNKKKFINELLAINKGILTFEAY